MEKAEAVAEADDRKVEAEEEVKVKEKEKEKANIDEDGDREGKVQNVPNQGLEAMPRTRQASDCTPVVCPSRKSTWTANAQSAITKLELENLFHHTRLAI